MSQTQRKLKTIRRYEQKGTGLTQLQDGPATLRWALACEGNERSLCWEAYTKQTGKLRVKCRQIIPLQRPNLSSRPGLACAWVLGLLCLDFITPPCLF